MTEEEYKAARHREQSRKWARDHPDKVREYQKRYCATHKEKILAYYAEYRKTHDMKQYYTPHPRKKDYI